MKLIDVFNMMTERKIKKGTKLIIVTPSGREYEYEYAIDIHAGHESFVDDYDHGISHMFNINANTLQYEVRLIEHKEKKYLVKLRIKGLLNIRNYLNYYNDGIKQWIELGNNLEQGFYQTCFTKNELRSIKLVCKFLEDMEGKYELIEVKENEID